MNAALWVQALRMAGGGQDAPAVTAAEVAHRLAHEVAADPDMRSVLNEWSRIICAIDRPGQGARPAMPAADVQGMGQRRAGQWRADVQTAGQAKARRRERQRQRRQRAKGVMA